MGEVAKVTSLCTVFADSDRLNGQEVRVTAFSVQSVHIIEYSDQSCRPPYKNLAVQLNFEDLDPQSASLFHEYHVAIDRDGAVQLTVVGIFLAEGHPYGPEMLPYMIRVKSILAVHKLSAKYIRKHLFRRK